MDLQQQWLCNILYLRVLTKTVLDSREAGDVYLLEHSLKFNADV